MTTIEIARATFDRLAEVLTADADYWEACEQLDITCAPDALGALEALTAVAAEFIEALRQHIPDRRWSLLELDELTVDAPPTMTAEDSIKLIAFAYANARARGFRLPTRDFDLDDVATARAACRALAQLSFAAAGILIDEAERPRDAERVVRGGLQRAAARAHLVARPVMTKS